MVTFILRIMKYMAIAIPILFLLTINIGLVGVIVRKVFPDHAHSLRQIVAPFGLLFTALEIHIAQKLFYKYRK